MKDFDGIKMHGVTIRNCYFDFNGIKLHRYLPRNLCNNILEVYGILKIFVITNWQKPT
jgi:hypothetical protein